MGLFKPTVLTAHVKHKGHDIVFMNSWSLLPYRSRASLKVDGVELADSTEMLHLDPHKPLFSLENVAPNLETVDVFFIGVFSAKCSIVVNGEVLHKDPIDVFDKIQARMFQS